MIQPIIKNTDFLCQPSVEATAEDLQVVQDLLDTLTAHTKRCVGLAANMIGVSKCIIVVEDEGRLLVMLNPEMLKSSEPFQTQEACLSLEGVRKTKRYKSIKIRYQNTALQTRIKTFKGVTAQIIQHEMDHLRGILI